MRLLSDLRADFARTRSLFGRATVLVFRLNQAAYRSPVRLLLVPLAGVLDLLWTRLLMGAEIPAGLQCGPGLTLHHGGRGVIINKRVRIGSDAVIYHRVTMGQSGPDVHNVPTVGDGVYFGTGATIVGGVKLGDGCKIGAGAVVVRDVPSGATAIGVPAQVQERRSRTEPRTA